MKSTLSVFLILFSTNFLLAQPEVVVEFPSPRGELLAYQLSDEYGVFFWDKQPIVLGVNLASGQVDTLHMALSLPRIHQTKQHSYLISVIVKDGYPESSRLHIFDGMGQEVVVDDVQVADAEGNWYYRGKMAGKGDRFYFSARTPDYEYVIWESDGSASGTQVVASFPEEILLLHEFQEQLLVLTRSDDGTGALAHRLDRNQDLAYLGFMPYQFVSNDFPRIIGESDTHVYLVGVDSASTGHIWRTDMTAANTELFLTGYDGRAIDFFGQKFLITDRSATWIGDLNQPQGLSKVELESRFRQGGFISSILPLAHPEYSLSGTARTGFEIARINPSDSLEIVADFAPFASSSYPFYGAFGGAIFSVRDAAGDLILPLTNRQDAYVYLYRVTEQGFESLARLDPAYRLIRLYFRDGFLYWEESALKGGSYRLMRMDPHGPHEKQPTETADPEVWYREIAVTSDRFLNQNVNNVVEPKGLDVDAEGNVFASFKAMQFMAPDYPRFVIHSHSPDIDRLRGLEIVAKYDPLGNLLWWKSLGGTQQDRHSGHKMCVDPAGDLVVFGGFFQKAYFDDDSLTAPGNGHFLAKLDGETGNVKWFKNPTTGYNEKLGSGGKLQTDQAGNIYLPFFYFGFGLDLDQASLWHNLSPVDALASYSPEGKLRWARTLPAPWTNSRTASHVFLYDSTRQRLLLAQSQGAYSVRSSCEWDINGYFLQTLDLEGNLLDTLYMSGSDLGGITAAALNTDGDLAGFGYYRGTLQMAPFETTSFRQGRACHTFEGFAFRRKETNGNIVSLQTAPSPTFFPFDAAAAGDFIYVIGARDSSKRGQTAELFKFTSQMNLVGYLPLGQYAPAFDSHTRFLLTVKNGYLHIAGTNFRQHVPTGVSQHISQVYTLSLLKIRDEGWLPAEEAFVEIPLLYQINDPSVMVFPNPVSGSTIRVMFSQNARDYTGYQLFDLQGRRLGAGILGEDALQQIELPGGLAPGYFVLRFTGPGAPVSVKLVKE